MTRVFNLIPGAVGQSKPDIVSGQVSARQPAPRSFSDPLYVVIPDWNPDIYFTISDWPAINGSALPVAGNDVTLLYDDQDNMRVVWWSGSAKFATEGVSDAMVAGTVSVAESKITSTSRLQLTRQAGGTNPGAVFESSRSPGVGFTVVSTNASDTGTVAYSITEP